jgi:16S rRNA C1402 (ribose-2'-O) methylase RsmI
MPGLLPGHVFMFSGFLYHKNQKNVNLAPAYPCAGVATVIYTSVHKVRDVNLGWTVSPGKCQDDTLK